MRRSARVPVALVLAASPVAVTLPACDASTDPAASDPIALGTDDPPFRGAWQTVHAGPFIPLHPDGSVAIEDLVIGRTAAFDGNFENRGDVIVEFDAEPGTIAIELRPFAAAPTPAEAEAIQARLGLWAFHESIDAPLPPAAMDPATRCDLAATWPDGCAIYVHFDGDVQPPGSGADLRVHLPADYRRKVAIGTADNVPSEAYPNRGNVCVAGLPGHVEVELGSGIAAITVAVDSSMPSCPAALVSACEAYDDPSTPGPDAWDADCPCFAEGYESGLAKVESIDDGAADITIDVPAGLWASFRGENAGENNLAGKHCLADVDSLENLEFGASGNDPNKPWLAFGVANKPPEAPASGFRLDARSTGCEAVADVADPDAWDPSVTPPTTLRGNVELCVGCLADRSCDELLPGG